MRIESDPVVVRGSGSKSDDIELPDRTQGRSSKGPGGRRFPRLGLDALFHESRPSQDLTEDGTVEFFKVYKRRWFGLVQLTLLNIVVSWDVSLICFQNICQFRSQFSSVFGEMSCIGSRSTYFIGAEKHMHFCRPPSHAAYAVFVRGSVALHCTCIKEHKADLSYHSSG